MRFIKIAEVIQMTGLSRATIYEKVKEGTFPKQVKPTTKASFWVDDEITEWMEELIRQRDE